MLDILERGALIVQIVFFTLLGFQLAGLAHQVNVKRTVRDLTDGNPVKISTNVPLFTGFLLPYWCKLLSHSEDKLKYYRIKAVINGIYEPKLLILNRIHL